MDYRNVQYLVKVALPVLVLGSAWGFVSHASETGNTTDWHWWRGPNRDGISSEKGWLSTWPEAGLKQLWRFSVGVGYSSVSVSKGRVYTMGNVNNTDTVYCLNAETGKVVWKHSYKCRQGSWKGTRIAPTVDGNRVYTVSREGNLFCFNAA